MIISIKHSWVVATHEAWELSHGFGNIEVMDFGGVVRAKSRLELVQEGKQGQTDLGRKFTAKGSRGMI